MRDSSDLMSSSGHVEFDSTRATFRWLGHQRGHSCRRRWAAGISSTRNQMSFDHRIVELSDSPMTFLKPAFLVYHCVYNHISYIC